VSPRAKSCGQVIKFGAVLANRIRLLAARYIERLLGESGDRLEEVCVIVTYLTDIRFRGPIYQVVGRWLEGVQLVSTWSVGDALARPEWLVEIDATAVILRDAVGEAACA
jgi:enamine deaminase RidA (YjgF/YER057c/UK114 family)